MKSLKSLFLTFTMLFGLYANAQNYGCTDPSANNFDPSADTDNGYCCYENYLTIQASNNIANVEFYSLQSFYGMYWQYYNDDCFPDGCVTTVAQRLDNAPAWVSVYNNGELVLTITEFEEFGGYYGFGSGVGNFTLGEVTLGCTNGFACNFNPNATCDDGSCDTTCAGCTDPAAANFNPVATINDGSCCEGSNYLSLTINGVAADLSGFYFYSFGAAFEFAPGTFAGCLPDGCWTAIMLENNLQSGDSCSVTNANGEVLAFGALSEFGNGVTFSINAIEGCPDYTACNYNPLSTCYDYSGCTYDCYGCTNPTSGNYDPTATVDDGSCCDEYYTIVADGALSWSAWSPYNYSGGYGYYPYQTGICLQSGCYNFSTGSQYDPETGTTPNVSWQLLDTEGNIVLSGSTLPGIVQTFTVGEIIEGCNNASACNYNPNANCGGQELCTYDCYGCTDPTATNYDEAATLDNGTCCFNEWYTISATVPGNWSVNTSFGGYYLTGIYPADNGFCSFEGCGNFSFHPTDYLIWEYEVIIYNSNGEVVATLINNEQTFENYVFIENNAISGCGDMYACNYDPNINCFDYSLCDYSCYGCTDATAPNYNPNATLDNGSCCYGTWYTIEMTGPAYWSAYDTQTGAYYYGDYPGQTGFCIGTECFQFQAWSYFGEEISYTVFNAEGVAIVTESFDYAGEMLLVNPNNSIVGCGDSNACNYDPNADCNDYYSCDYSCYGCTDASAPNYDPSATLDNGSCCNNNWLNVTFSEPCYWFATDDNYNTWGGFYPEQSGFCTSGSCIGFYAYNFSNQLIDFQVTDQDGNVVLSGTSSTGGYVSNDLSLGTEIAGCTDAMACNYNELATCNNGTCDYYCAGCTDAAALNYDPLVEFEDGSCIYEMELPNLGMNIITDEENEQYYVLLSMMEEGNGAPYVLSNSYNNEFEMIAESGQYMSGPYPCDEQVEMSLVSMSAGLATYYNAAMESACAQISSVNQMADINEMLIFPNPATNSLSISGLPNGKVSITLRDISGREVWSQQMDKMNGLIELDLNQAPGVYFVNAEVAGVQYTKRLIIE